MTINAIRIAPEELKRVSVHESGHAVMAAIQGIACRGLFFAYEPSQSGEIRGGRFCVPVGNNPPWKKGDYCPASTIISPQRQLDFPKDVANSFTPFHG